MSLGPKWLKKFDVPYVIDFQDPWVSDYYKRTHTPPPGGHLRYAFAQWQARWSEPRVVRDASHVITVSPAYVSTLRERYPDVPIDRFSVLPFAASEGDFQAVKESGTHHHLFDPNDGLQHWVYLGRGGMDMARGLKGFFRALAELRRTNPSARKVRVHFIGTSYAPKGRAVQTIRPLAIEAGVGDVVNEETDRVPYLTGLSLLRDADVILIVGSDDPTYSASKIYPCVLARRPLLAILHESSPAGTIIQNLRAGDVVPFKSDEPVELLSSRVVNAMLKLMDSRPLSPSTDWVAFEQFTARGMTKNQCRIFSRC